jgi:hypothetical protein
MKTQKVTLTELRTLVKNIIKEENEYERIANEMDKNSILVTIDTFSKHYKNNYNVYEYFKNKYGDDFSGGFGRSGESIFQFYNKTESDMKNIMNEFIRRFKYSFDENSGVSIEFLK